MKNENLPACPNCSELWNRIDRLEQENAKVQKQKYHVDRLLYDYGNNECN